jgi:hypothetical protein
MKETQETKLFPNWSAFANYPLIKGPLLGSIITYIISPGLNWTNQVLNNTKMIWTPSNAMKGSFTYACSALPTYGVVFGTKNFLNWKFESKSSTSDLLKSFIAGGISGFIQTPFDAIAQNKQLAKDDAISQNKQLAKDAKESTVKLMLKNNGYRSFFQGALVTMLREGVWSMVYLSATPIVSEYLQSQGIEKNKADALTLIFIAAPYGFFSTPCTKLRYEKQVNLTQPNEPKSYLEHTKNIWNKNPQATTFDRFKLFYKGCLPRTLTVTLAAGLIIKGNELYDEVVKKLNK